MEYLSSEETVHNEDVDHFLSPGKVYEKSRSIEGESNDLQVQPLSWIPSILILVLFSVLYFLAYHRIIPSYIERTGQPYLIAYLWVWVVSMGVVLLTSLIL